jgi:hypothetical protein
VEPRDSYPPDLYVIKLKRILRDDSVPDSGLLINVDQSFCFFKFSRSSFQCCASVITWPPRSRSVTLNYGSGFLIFFKESET